MPPDAILISLGLLIVANSAPVIAAKLCQSRWARPVDGGRHFVNGRPWFGSSKTWRGLLAAIITTALIAPLLGIAWQLGLCVGLFAMLGDLSSSFIKRRLGIPSSGRGWLLDQIPEALLPLALLWQPLGLRGIADILIVVAVFTLLDMVLSPLFYRLHIRKRPY